MLARLDFHGQYVQVEVLTTSPLKRFGKVITTAVLGKDESLLLTVLR